MNDELQTVMIRKEINAPGELVWKALTDKDQFKLWRCPDHYKIEECQLQVWPEGELRIVMRGPEGLPLPTTGRYKEVREPKLLSYTTIPASSDGTELFQIMQTFELEETEEITTLRLTAGLVWASDEAAAYLKRLEEELRQAIDKLATLTESVNG